LSKAPTVTVTDRENAKKTEYTKTILIDPIGNKSAQAAELAKALGITVAPLPQGESPKPQDATLSADFIIIVGMDKK